MGRLLTAIGLLIVALFAVAAIAPYVIDWTSQKVLFEREASRRFGTPVVVDGRMEVSFLPTPVLTLEGVRIGAPGAEARIETMRLDLSLGALMRGDVLVNTAHLVSPRVRVTLDAAGQLSTQWMAPDAAAVNISRFVVESGELSIEDANGGRFAVDGLAFSGEASSLAGPFRADGSARFEGRPATFTLNTGRADAGQLRLRFIAEPSDDPVSVEFDGALNFGETRPALTGALKLRGLGAREAAQRDTGWRLEAAIEARPERIRARDLRLVPGSEDRMLQFTGEANVALGRQARLEAALSLRQIDFDRLADVNADNPADVAGVMSRLFGLPIAALTAAIDMDLSFDVGSAVLAGGLVQELKLRVETRDGRWRLSSVEARLPGNATLKASGNFGLRGGPLVFHGPVELTVRAPTAFSSWLQGELLRPRPARPAPGASTVALSGRLTIAPERIALDALSAQVGAAAISGSAELLDPSRRLIVRLSAPDVDLEPLVTLAGALAPRAASLQIAAVDAVVRADRLRYRSLEVRRLDVTVRSGPDGIIAERLSGILNGLTVSGDGRLATDGTGGLSVRLAGERLAPALVAIESTFGTHPVLELLRSRAPALGAVTADASLTRRGAQHVLTLAGGIGGSRIEATVTADALDPRPAALSRLTLALSNPRLDLLLAQLGIDAVPGPGGAGGRLSVLLERRAGARHALTLDAELAQSRLAASGDISLGGDRIGAESLAVRAESGDVAPLLFAFGVPIAEAGEVIDTRLNGRLALVDGEIRLAGIEGTVTGQPVRGALSLSRGEPPRAEGRLELGEVGLDRVLSLIAGPWPALGNREVWPSAAFGPRPLPPLTGAVSVTARRVRLDRLALDEARFTVRIDENGLTVDGLTGLLAGGRLAGEIVATRPEAGLRLQGRFALAGARLEDLVWARGGRPVATAQLDARLAFDGTGRSPSVLLGNLAGQGSLTLGAGELRGVAVGGFTAGLRASEAGVDVEEARLTELVRRELDAGALPFSRLEAALTVQSGIIRASNLTLDGAPAAATGRLAVDLPRWSMDAELTLEGPSARQGQRGPRIGLLFGGQIEAPDRRIDVKPFVDYLNLRRFEREVERLETLQREIEARERLLREIEERERERRARAAPEPPRTPPAEAPGSRSQQPPPSRPGSSQAVPPGPPSPAPPSVPSSAPPGSALPSAVDPLPSPTPATPPPAVPPPAAPPARAAEAAEPSRSEAPPPPPPQQRQEPAALIPLPPPVVIAPAPALPPARSQPLQLLPQR